MSKPVITQVIVHCAFTCKAVRWVVLSIKAVPDVEVIVGSNDLFEVLNKLLQIQDIKFAVL